MPMSRANYPMTTQYKVKSKPTKAKPKPKPIKGGKSGGRNGY